MAKTKVELEDDLRQHQQIMAKVRKEHRSGQTVRAVELAVKAWDHIDGMLQYERRYGERTEFKSIDSIDFVLSYAPLLLDAAPLDQLAGLLKSQRRIEKNTSTDVGQKLTDAIQALWNAHRLWVALEAEGEIYQGDIAKKLGGNQSTWRDMVDTWTHLGVVERRPQSGSYMIRLKTRIERVSRAKCPACGSVESEELVSLLESRTCGACGTSGHFVLLPITD